MSMAAHTMGLAPMLAILFLACRMRALQMDPINGNPQRWAQNCFFLCTYAIIFQTCISVFVPLVLGGTAKPAKNGIEGDMEYESDYITGFVAKALTVVRFLIMLSVYAGSIAVVCSAFTIEHPDGAEHTIPISPTMQCVVNLAFQYFFIYFLLWVLLTVEDFKPDWKLAKVKDALHSAQATVKFAPMLSILFVATRMRALQISDNKGAPQGWAQDGMYMASWALLIQFLMCLLLPVVTGTTYKTDSLDGEESATKEPTDSKWGNYVCITIRYIALIFLYSGMVMVIVSVFLITPETANGRGSVPVLGDGTLPVDLIPGEPIGVNDIPGAKGGMETVGEGVGAGADVATTARETVTEPVTAVTDEAAATVTETVSF